MEDLRREIAGEAVLFDTASVLRSTRTTLLIQQEADKTPGCPNRKDEKG